MAVAANIQLGNFVIIYSPLLIADQIYCRYSAFPI